MVGHGGAPRLVFTGVEEVAVGGGPRRHGRGTRRRRWPRVPAANDGGRVGRDGEEGGSATERERGVAEATRARGGGRPYPQLNHSGVVAASGRSGAGSAMSAPTRTRGAGGRSSGGLGLPCSRSPEAR